MSERSENTPQIFTSTAFYTQKDGKRVNEDQIAGFDMVSDFINPVKHVFGDETQIAELLINTGTLLRLRRLEEPNGSVGLKMFFGYKTDEAEKETYLHINKVVIHPDFILFESRSTATLVKIEKTQITFTSLSNRDEYRDTFRRKINPPIP